MTIPRKYEGSYAMNTFGGSVEINISSTDKKCFLKICDLCELFTEKLERELYNDNGYFRKSEKYG